MGVGDRVRHIKFGEGTVTAVVEGGRDYEVTIDFDGPGTKKNVCGICKIAENIRGDPEYYFYKFRIKI